MIATLLMMKSLYAFVVARRCMLAPNPQILVNGSAEQDATGARKEFDGVHDVFMATKYFEDALRV
jgi:hypothetical protein